MNFKFGFSIFKLHSWGLIYEKNWIMVSFELKYDLSRKPCVLVNCARASRMMCSSNTLPSCVFAFVCSPHHVVHWIIRCPASVSSTIALISSSQKVWFPHLVLAIPDSTLICAALNEGTSQDRNCQCKLIFEIYRSQMCELQTGFLKSATVRFFKLSIFQELNVNTCLKTILRWGPRTNLRLLFSTRNKSLKYVATYTTP